MPTYEFRCPNGHTFDRFYRSIGTSEAQTACPECGQMAERMMSAGAGLLFKGSGFYLTDYGKDAHKKKAPETKGEGAKGEASSASGGDGAAASSSSSTGGDSAKPEAKPAESKPAPKPSSGE